MPSQAEIQRWLVARTTFKEAVAAIELARWQKTTNGVSPRTPWWLWPLVPVAWLLATVLVFALAPRRAKSQTFEEWHQAHFAEGDELWRYESVIPGERDERGFAILRGELVVNSWGMTSVDIDWWPIPEADDEGQATIQNGDSVR